MRTASQQVSESASQPDTGAAAHRRRTRHFSDLIAWQKAMLLAKAIYGETSEFPKSEIYGLTSQMRRSAVSVPSNIAEGHGRLTDRGLKVFLAQARGSVFELETQVQLASDIGYMHADNAMKLASGCNEVARILNGLIKVLGGEDS
jgi:four helix bundle protein